MGGAITDDNIINGTGGFAPSVDPRLDGTPTNNKVVIGVLLGVIAVLACMFWALTIPLFVRYLRRKKPVPQKTIDSRYDTIEGWLITKRARAHTGACKHATTAECDGDAANKQELPESTTNNHRAKLCLVSSYDTADTCDDDDDDDSLPMSLERGECQECPICMEEFQEGDIVSWSPSLDTSCNHVFHHHCVKVRVCK